MAVPPKRPAIAGSRSNGRRIDHRPARGGMRVYGAFPSLLRPDWWARATTHRPVSSRPGGHRPPPTARFRPDLVATGHHPPPGFVPTWWLPATTHRPVSSRPGGYRPPPTARFLPDLVARTTTHRPVSSRPGGPGHHRHAIPQSAPPFGRAGGLGYAFPQQPGGACH